MEEKQNSVSENPHAIELQNSIWWRVMYFYRILIMIPHVKNPIDLQKKRNENSVSSIPDRNAKYGIKGPNPVITVP